MAGTYTVTASLSGFKKVQRTGVLLRAASTALADVRLEVGGLLSTAGDVIFGGGLDVFFALDARTGRVLWRAGLGGIVHAAPVTYLSKGRQQVTIAAAQTLFTFALPAP